AETGEPGVVLSVRLLAAAAERAQAVAGMASADVAQPSREATTAVQSELRRRGYTIDAVTGDLDAQTRNAIMQYQADAGMAVTGQPSAALLAHMRASGPQQGPDRLQLVRSIQDELNRRGYDAGPADGVLGPKTRSAIRAYQSDAGLPVTGDPSESLLAGLRGAASSQAAVAPDGDRALVRDIQAELKQRGFYAGEVDGTLDGPTEAAIRSYQAAMRMPQTGEASVDLLASLRISDRGQGGMMASDLVRDVERALRSRGYAVPA